MAIVTRYRDGIHITYSETLDFGVPAAVPGTVSLVVNTGEVRIGDAVDVGPPVTIGGDFLLDAWVSSDNNITVRWTQITGVASDPDGAGGTYCLYVTKP